MINNPPVLDVETLKESHPDAYADALLLFKNFCITNHFASEYVKQAFLWEPTRMLYGPNEERQTIEEIGTIAENYPALSTYLRWWTTCSNVFLLYTGDNDAFRQP